MNLRKKNSKFFQNNQLNFRTFSKYKIDFVIKIVNLFCNSFCRNLKNFLHIVEGKKRADLIRSLKREKETVARIWHFGGTKPSLFYLSLFRA